MKKQDMPPKLTIHYGKGISFSGEKVSYQEM